MSRAMEKRWAFRSEPDQRVVEELMHDRCTEAVARLLASRGMTSPEEASLFFRPGLDQLLDPFLMKDMDRAVARIERALGDHERIMVYGDYDVDGTTAVALVYSFLQRFTGELIFHIPDRYSEGYGISFAGVERAHREGCTLIIALDCGIKAHDKVERARELGIDMIICDHHRPGDMLPPALAVLDPKRDDCPYPFKELSGCGIGFKLVQALAQHNDMPIDELLPLLDLVAVSTACDIVPVNGENRVLAHAGLIRLNQHPRAGFKAMLQMANVKRRLCVTDLVFTLGPRINAAGRIEHGQQAVELLLARDLAEAERIALRVDGHNVQRQELDKDITREALGLLASDPLLQDAWSTVLFKPTWHKGVIGIVASRLIEQYYRPTIVLTESNGMVVGSARSVRGFDIYEAINACSDLLEQFGGHMYAAGLTMGAGQVEAFRTRFEEVVRATLPPSSRIPIEEVDLEVGLDAFDARLVNVLRHMAPFGPANMRPTFVTRGLVDTGSARIVGSDHLKLSVRSADGTGPRFDAIAFKQAHHLDLVRSGEPFSALYTLEENEWQGRTELQLNIKDIKEGSDAGIHRMWEERLSLSGPQVLT
jgi:single-stranded-DNA-specific exonuclease